MFLYIFFPQCAHRMVAYFEEQACISYTEYLKEIDDAKNDSVNSLGLSFETYKEKNL